MKKIIKIVIVVLVVFLSLFLITSLATKRIDDDKITIISTTFPGYDFARAVVGDNEEVEIEMLLAPGSESHTYEPSPQDIINIGNADMFIYVGGESDEWVEEILSDIDTSDMKIIKLMDYVTVYEEEIVEGMEVSEEHDHDAEESEEHDHEEVEYDEHVWTSPVNAIILVEEIGSQIIEILPDSEEELNENKNNYMSELEKIDLEIVEVVENAVRTEVIFGDRFPLRYFVSEYNLDYYAAFPGCSEQTEASAATIAFLIDKVNEDNIPVIFSIELSSNEIAQAIADETDAVILEFHAAHNITQTDFDNGVTYVELMQRNIEALKEALY